MYRKKIKLSLVFTLSCLFLLAACEQQNPSKVYPLHYSDAIMGTSFTVKASVLPNTLTADELKLKIKSLLDNLNGQMSTYQSDSELSKINQNQSSDWLVVSDSLYTVLKQAKAITVLSQGAFDITVGPLVNLWGFGPDPMSFTAPEDKLIAQALTKIGVEHLLFDDQTRKIKKRLPDLYLDLSAIAKGYAVDRVGELLEQNGITNYMVEIGGELRLKGNNIQQQPWRIAVEKPSVEQRMIQKVLPLTNIALATSGDYRNFFEQKGVRFSHTIDPRIGRPITHKLASVTILNETAMKADALATAMMVLGVEQGLELAEQEQIAALFIVKTDAGFIEQASTAFINKLR